MSKAKAFILSDDEAIFRQAHKCLSLEGFHKIYKLSNLDETKALCERFFLEGECPDLILFDIDAKDQRIPFFIEKLNSLNKTEGGGLVSLFEKMGQPNKEPLAASEPAPFAPGHQNQEALKAVKVATLALSSRGSRQSIVRFIKAQGIGMVRAPFTQQDFHAELDKAMREAGRSLLPYTLDGRKNQADYTAFFQGLNKIIAKGDLGYAENLVRARLDSSPDAPQLALALLSLLLDQGKLEEAERLLSAQETPPESDSLGFSILAARLALKKGAALKDPLSHSILSMADRKDPLDPDGFLSENSLKKLIEQAESFLKKGNLRGAQDKYQKVLSVDPQHREAAFGLARVAMEKGQEEEARDILFGLAVPDSLAAEFNLKAIARAKEGDLREAISLYRQSLKYVITEQKKPSIYYNMALAYARLGEYRAASLSAARAAEFGHQKARAFLEGLEQKTYAS